MVYLFYFALNVLPLTVLFFVHNKLATIQKGMVDFYFERLFLVFEKQLWGCSTKKQQCNCGLRHESRVLNWGRCWIKWEGNKKEETRNLWVLCNLFLKKLICYTSGISFLINIFWNLIFQMFWKLVYGTYEEKFSFPNVINFFAGTFRKKLQKYKRKYEEKKEVQIKST